MHTTPRPAWFATAAIVTAVLAGVGAVWAGTALDQAAHPPTCHGIGWGCTPDPATIAVFAAVIFGLPAVGGGVVLTWVGWATTRRTGRRAHMAATWTPAALLVVASTALWVQVARAASG